MNIHPYAGFWKRAFAFLLDSIILAIPTTIVNIIIMVLLFKPVVGTLTSATGPSPDIMMSIMGRYMACLALIFVSSVLIGWLYYALMESGKKQATLGKLALGIKVVDEKGQRISFARATGRFFGKWISSFVLSFGFYMAGFTRKRQALHDMLASTFVVNNTYQETEPLPELPFSTGGCVAGILAAIAPVVLYVLFFVLAMMAAMAGMEQEDFNATLARPTAITQQR